MCIRSPQFINAGFYHVAGFESIGHAKMRSKNMTRVNILNPAVRPCTAISLSYKSRNETGVETVVDSASTASYGRSALCVTTRQTVQRRGDHLTNDMHRYQQQRQPLSSDPRLRRVCEMVWRYIVYNIPGCSMTLFIRYIINTVLQLYYLDVMNSSMNASFHIRSLNYWWIVTCVLTC